MGGLLQLEGGGAAIGGEWGGGAAIGGMGGGKQQLRVSGELPGGAGKCADSRGG